MIEIIDYLFPIIFIIGAISFIIFFILGVVNKLNNLGKTNDLSYFEENIYFRTSAILAIISFISIFSLSFYVNKLSRAEIKEKLENQSDKKITLYINDTIKNNDSLIVALKNIRKTTSARNTGSIKIDVLLKIKNETISLMLLRDFNQKAKYWVHYKNYKTTTDNCVGEINTNFLNEYKSNH